MSPTAGVLSDPATPIAEHHVDSLIPTAPGTAALSIEPISFVAGRQSFRGVEQ